MGKTNSFKLNILKLLFNNVALPNIGNAGGLQPSSVAGSFYIALFTGDPGEDGSVTDEATYIGYARKAVARSIAGWAISANNCSNTAAIIFAECTGGSDTITHLAIMTDLSGGNMIYKGQLTVPLIVSSGDIPKFEIGNSDIFEN